MELAAKVAFLRQPGTYPDRPVRVEAIETHISWVFLTDRFAYKLKKPVRHPYLDFRTVDARHQDCLEEVRLNRRLAGDVYLRVLPLTATGGRLHLDGPGRTIDWLVHMRRLPAERMLDRLIRTGALQPTDLRHLGERLARFYRDLEPVGADLGEYIAGFESDIEENRRELGASALPADRVARVCRGQREFLEGGRELFAARLDDGRIVEGHGDLRPEHVCLADEPLVIDCLEFKRAFRILDAADELAFLALECERLGVPDAAVPLFAAYAEVTGDRPPAALIHFYQCFRALLRAKLAIWHNHDQDIRDRDKWVRRALGYLALAERHADATPLGA